MPVNDFIYDQGGAVLNVRNVAFGATGSGTSDDGPAILAAESAPSAGDLYIPAGTYLIGSDLNLTRRLILADGAILKPASGTIVTITGSVEAGPRKWIDLSLDGAVSFPPSAAINRYYLDWWLKGDGTDEQSELNALIAAIPDGAILTGSLGKIYGLSETWIIENRRNLRIDTGHDPMVLWEGAPHLKWLGSAGGTIVAMTRDMYCTFAGFAFESGPADVCLDVDGESPPQVGTQCLVERCLFENSQARASWVGVRFSESARNNQEFHAVRRSVFAGAGGVTTLGGLSIAHGSTQLDSTSEVFSAGDIGRRVRIASAGSPDGLLPLDTTITAFTSATAVSVATACQATDDVEGTYGLLGETLGTGIKIGQSPNAKSYDIVGCNFNALSHAINCGNGPRLSANSFYDNEVNLYLLGSTEPVIDDGANMEYCRQHLYAPNPFHNPVIFRATRFEFSRPAPNTGVIDLPFASGGRVILEGTETSGTSFPAGSGATLLSGGGINAIIIGAGKGPELDSLGAYGVPLGVGRATIVGSDIADNIGGNINRSASSYFMRGIVAAPPGGFPVIVGRLTANQDSDGSVDAAFRAELRGAVPNSGPTVAFRAYLAEDGVLRPNQVYVAFRAEMPVASEADLAMQAVGVHITSPSLTFPARLNSAQGVVVEPQLTPVVGQGIGIDQQGTTDLNNLDGQTRFGNGSARISKLELYTPNLTPTSVPAQSVSEQTFTVVGLSTSDVLNVTPPSSSDTTAVGARVSAPDTVALRFMNPTTSASVPPSGEYTLLAFRVG